jgi:hypothetical protein
VGSECHWQELELEALPVCIIVCCAFKPLRVALASSRARYQALLESFTCSTINMEQQPIARRLRSSMCHVNNLPDEVLAIIFSLLDIESLLLRGSLVCKLWRQCMNTRRIVLEGSCFDLDPFAVLGPENVTMAHHGGLPALEIARRLGDSRCGTCGKRFTRFFSLSSLSRICTECPTPNDDPEAVKFLINRFFYPRKREVR